MLCFYVYVLCLLFMEKLNTVTGEHVCLCTCVCVCVRMEYAIKEEVSDWIQCVDLLVSNMVRD